MATIRRRRGFGSLAGRFAEGVPVEICVLVGHASAEARAHTFLPQGDTQVVRSMRMTPLLILGLVVVGRVDVRVSLSLSDSWHLHQVSTYPPCHLSWLLNCQLCFHDGPYWAINALLSETPDSYLRASSLCEL